MSTGRTQTIEDLESLGLGSPQLQQLQKMQTGNEDDIETPTEDMEQIKESESKRKDAEEEDFEDVDFGYLGREDFLVEPQPKTTKKALKKFGYDYFIDRPSTFAPLSGTPVPPDYIIGPGDEIKLMLYGNNNRNYSLRVTRDGDIYLPEIGPISIAGLTFLDLKETIDKMIASQLIGTQVTLTLGELSSINIFVLGEAAQPGMYTVSSLTRMTNAIFASGGIKTTGSLRNIELKRNGKVISNFDLYRLLLGGDASNDVRLMQGDILFVPPIKKTVAIEGEVQRPGIYELLESETAQDLIRYAGNVKAKANLSIAEIKRISSTKKGFNLLIADLSQTNTSDLLLNDGDILSIYPVESKIERAILIKGHFSQPGFFPWSEEMKLSDVFKSRADLLPMTDLNYALVERKNDNEEPESFMHIDLEKFFENPDSKYNISLNDKDEITLFPELSFCEITSQEEEIILQEEEITLQEEEITFDGDEITSEEEEITTATEEITTVREECRRELIDPVIELIKNTSTNDKVNTVVRVIGNVLFPGQYPLTKDATVQDMLNAAGKLGELSYTNEVEISRTTITNKELVTTQIIDNYDQIKDLLVQPRDIISIKKISSPYETVNLEGEVFFPGEYPIKKGETLLSVIARAGSFTANANPDNLIFTREAIADQQRANLEKTKADLQRQLTLVQAETSGDAAIDQKEYFQQLQSLATESAGMNQLLGRLVVNLDQILKGQISDVELRDGDSIFIPQDIQTISVIGEVYSPNAHFYDPNISVSEYIEFSGGVSKFGDSSEAYIIKGDGSVVKANSLRQGGGFFRSDLASLEGGDTIVIPLEIRTFPGIELTNDITQIVYQLAVATAAVNSF